MALKKSLKYIRGKRPRKIKDLTWINEIDNPDFFYYGAGVVFDPYVIKRIWEQYTSELSEYEQEIIDEMRTEIQSYCPYDVENPERYLPFISDYIIRTFGERRLLDKYFDYIEEWDGTEEDYQYIIKMITGDVEKCAVENRYKWGNLMKSTMLEFNPLWNVDAHEETVRTLEQDGTITNQKRGTETEDEDTTTTTATATTDTLNRTGTETSAKTGTERTLTDETTEDSKTGTETTVLDYGELTTNNTTDETSYSGSEITSHQSAITSTESATTTESETFYPTRKTVNTGIGDDNQDEKTYSARKDTLERTGTVGTDKDSTETLTHNTTESIDHDSDVTITHNTSDTLTRNTSDNGTSATNETNVLDKTNTLTHNTDDTETRDLTDTERTVYDRHGNIGTTTTTKLLDEFRAYTNFSVMKVIAHDIVNFISNGVY